ncbi:MAG: EAL domain-containing protein [Thiohalomonadaceae bacterium]
MDIPPRGDEEQVPEEQRALEHLIAGSAALLADLDQANAGETLDRVLYLTGEFLGVERAGLFLWAPDGGMLERTRQWSVPGLEDGGQFLRAVEYPWWLGQLSQGAAVVPDVNALPGEATAERLRFEAHGVGAVLAAPVSWNGRLQGFVAVECLGVARTWTEQDVRVLKVIAHLFSSALGGLHAREALRHSTTLLETTEALSHVGSWEWDLTSDRLKWSAEIYQIHGESPERFKPDPESVLARVHPADRPAFKATVQEALSQAKPMDTTLRILRPDGSVRSLRIQAHPCVHAGGRVERFIGTAQDVTELLRVQETMQRANRALQTISACNTAIVRATSEQELRDQVCRILVERGGYRLAWVLMFQRDGRLPPLPDGWFGDVDEAFFREILASPAGGGEPHCLEALLGAEPLVIRDVATSRLPHKDAWIARGLNACVGLPLKGNGRNLGVLVIHSDQPATFDDEEIAHLKELASDLAYGIGALRSRKERDEARKYLEATEQSLRAALERDTDGVIVTDRSARILFANPAAQDMLGRPFERLQGEPFAFPVVSGEKTEITLLRPDGSLVIAEMRAAETEWYKVPAMVIAMHDVTEQRRAEEQLRIWATVLERSGELIFVTDAERRIIAVNRAFEAITGYTAEEALGRDPRFLASGLEDKAFYTELWNSVKTTGHWQGEIRDRRKNGEILPLWLAITAATDARGATQHYIAIGSDVSERKAAEERIHFLAYHDALTGLPNRVLFKDRLGLTISHAQRAGTAVAVLFLDLDRFKNINDSLGHEAGDELLKIVAERLVHCVRRDDTVSRQGGDEFLLLLCQVGGPDGAAQVAAKILREVEKPAVIAGNEVHVTASVGIAVFPEDGTDPETLVRNADAAMYYAKERGRNNFQFFVADLNRRVSERLSLENALRRAIEREEFELYYQPQINGRTGRVEGVEALLRWHRGDRLVEPLEFVGVAEETGLIVPIGEWVMREACRQAAEWRDAGMPPARIAINLSATQFSQRGALDRLRDILMQGCVDPASMEVELTENTFMQETESSLHTLTTLKETGVGLAIDDFGTGYSNLNYLRRFPIDRLKVDQTFVRDLASDPIDRAVTEAIIALAKTLHVEVVAEGVETEEERRLLEERDCEIFQGYLFTPPLPAPEMTAWWRQRL